MGSALGARDGERVGGSLGAAMVGWVVGTVPTVTVSFWPKEQ